MCRRMRGNYGGGTTQRERRKTVVSTKPPAKPKPMDTPEWVVVDFDSRGFRCERCGTVEKHSTPHGVSRLESFALRGQAFAIDHSDCKEQSKG
jgi:hypothetical protein